MDKTGSLLSSAAMPNMSLSTSCSTHASLPAAAVLRLYVAARDLPEPDRRSRAGYAVLYVCDETRAPAAAVVGGGGGALVVESVLVRRAASQLKSMRRSNTLRAPHVAAGYTAPKVPTVHVRSDGTRVKRSSWRVLGVTEVARKQGRDVEFAKNFEVHFDIRRTQCLKVAFYDCTKDAMEEQRLIGTAESAVSTLVTAKGKALSFPLRFVAASERDVKKSGRIPVGSLLLTAAIVGDEGRQYRLDVQCSRILRAKALTYCYVKRMFYTIHAIVDEDAKSDLWTLLYRSDTVGMIRTKKDGGSLEYNYFSCRRLLAKPGMIFEDSDESGGGGEGGGAMSVLERVGAMIGLRETKRFFSLPGGDILLDQVGTRLKLTLFEDKGASAGFDMIADTEFTVQELQERKLGTTSAVKMRNNVVGKAVMKYKECSHEPRYFCLSLVMRAPR